MSQSERSKNALVVWRERQQAAKAAKVAELAQLRLEATTEIHDGREYRVVHLPDSYAFVTMLRVKV